MKISLIILCSDLFSAPVQMENYVTFCFSIIKELLCRFVTKRSLSAHETPRLPACSLHHHHHHIEDSKQSVTSLHHLSQLTLPVCQPSLGSRFP